MSVTIVNHPHVSAGLQIAVMVVFLSATAYAAAPGISGGNGTTAVFNLTAQQAYLNQPDGNALYSWGYGCLTAPVGFNPAMSTAHCPTMQVPGPTLVVTEGQTVTVTLTNNLPAPAGNTSILFPGFAVTATPGATQPSTCSTPLAPLVQGLLVPEAVSGCAVTYTFVASSPGTRAYYSGTQSDLQVEMGLYGAVIVLPATVPGACTTGLHAANLKVEAAHGEADFRLTNASGVAGAAYDHVQTCYDREYLFQFAEGDPKIHNQALAQIILAGSCKAGAPGCSLEVPTEPYHPAYFMINGRSMPDDMDPNYGVEYPHQPYNGNPHMHPGEVTLIRVIGQGRWQHPFHEHANHVRILARDGNLIISATDANSLAGPLQFTTTTTPGQAFDGLFYFTGRGLNWDMYAHNSGSSDGLATLPCYPDANGYYTVNSSPAAPVSTINYYEWCQDHNKPLQVAPVGDVAAGGPATLSNPNIFTNGAWYSGSPYLGPDATTRATGTTSDFQPSNAQANPPNERGWAFMWHSHNEREITTNNVFPGGMLMMMLVDSREFAIDESN